MTTTIVHPYDVAGEATMLSPFAPASADGLNKHHELGSGHREFTEKGSELFAKA